MQDSNNGFATVNLPSTNISWTVGPREFIFKYIKYLPWLLASIAIALGLAYLKIRYMPRIYHVQSSMLIKSDRPGSGQNDRFSEMFMNPGVSNLSNEIRC